MAANELDSLARAIDSVGKADFYEKLEVYLRQCMDFDNIVVIIFDGTQTPSVRFRRIYGPDVFQYIESDYLTGAYVLDPIYHFHLERGKSGIYRLLDVAPDQFKRSRYYEWYYGRIGITDEISIVMTIGRNMTATISMGKDGSSGDMFSSKADAVLRKHQPVIMALLKAHLTPSVEASVRTKPELSLTESLINAMRTRFAVNLSHRQAEVALLILRGHSSPSIGLNLDISPQTVKVFRKQLYRKCNLSSQAELFALMMPIFEQLTHADAA
ncbi:LuxR C-terminal-related transcriptional regulator [Phyllobacterium sp. 21LDTY02-6]|jgi:DNA-binding CsgD family transcriptional regulator|uniref:helix-turn-helix transcriptional regulator n=1 Tax=unclassified Phyllobacterium TaxID=2638441 RepID=UPI00201FED16|nr:MULTISPECIES: LuxR C-terminal-related transcriptional regulator [unclassified Phyllobacterium]MCO4316251.1 LuxR C-terminal-related transcriptional regulator [Phyllobacterium sp. 21LDTY02-6]MCX8282585.1 LuxR C-terminal-related transcriptional regulator [Phyllobacterium sp. 0TCS1.6C]MCX8292483.1 LuxR C-terminal-related transcriptional regulator [Phyllobacterium sp. 0TCS1.6A]